MAVLPGHESSRSHSYSGTVRAELDRLVGLSSKAKRIHATEQCAIITPCEEAPQLQALLHTMHTVAQFGIDYCIIDAVIIPGKVVPHSTASGTVQGMRRLAV